MDIVVTSQTTVVSGCVIDEEAHRSWLVGHPAVVLVRDGQVRLATLPERADNGDAITPCAGALAATDSGFLAGGGDMIGSLAWSSDDAMTWTMLDPDAPSALKRLQCGDPPPCIQWARVTAIAAIPGGRTVAVGRGDDWRSRAWWIANP